MARADVGLGMISGRSRITIIARKLAQRPRRQEGDHPNYFYYRDSVGPGRLSCHKQHRSGASKPGARPTWSNSTVTSRFISPHFGAVLMVDRIRSWPQIPAGGCPSMGLPVLVQFVLGEDACQSNGVDVWMVINSLPVKKAWEANVHPATIVDLVIRRIRGQNPYQCLYF